jgi:DNA-binding CsgD family transcriptional regulator
MANTIIDLWEQGNLSQMEIAELLNTDFDTVYNTIREYYNNN